MKRFTELQIEEFEEYIKELGYILSYTQGNSIKFYQYTGNNLLSHILEIDMEDFNFQFSRNIKGSVLLESSMAAPFYYKEHFDRIRKDFCDVLTMLYL